jgi:hypothetical protein
MGSLMSEMGQEPTSRHVGVMPVIPLKADIHQRSLHVRFVPEADIRANEFDVARQPTIPLSPT